MIRPSEITPENIESARKAGRRCAYKGISYDTGKSFFSEYEAPLLLAWSTGHNEARAHLIMMKYEGVVK